MGDTQLAVVSTPTYAPVFQKGGCLMALSHLVLSNKSYRSYFANAQRGPGQVLILDNGSFETGKPMAPDALAGICNMIQPTHVVLPDYIGSWKDTLEASYNALGYLEGSVQNVIFAPQGDTCDEYLQSIDKWMNVWVNKNLNTTFNLTIGISQKRKFHNGGCACARAELLQTLFVDRGWSGLPVHLLGIPDVNQFVLYELGLMDTFHLIESVDSSLPVALAYAGHILSTDSPKMQLPTNEAGLTSERTRLGRLNIQLLRKWITDGDAGTGAIPYKMMHFIATDGGNLHLTDMTSIMAALGFPTGYYRHDINDDTYLYLGTGDPTETDEGGLVQGTEVTAYVSRTGS